jgi:hypothetical protein
MTDSSQGLYDRSQMKIAADFCRVDPLDDGNNMSDNNVCGINDVLARASAPLALSIIG